MSALAYLLAMLKDRVPPKYKIPLGNITEILRSRITEPMKDEEYLWFEIQKYKLRPYEDWFDDVPEPEALYELITDINGDIRPYYEPPFKMPGFSIKDYDEDIYDFMRNHWNALYNDLHPSGTPAKELPDERKVKLQYQTISL